MSTDTQIDLAIEPIPAHELADEAIDLFAPHAQECEPDLAEQLELDWDAYHAAQLRGQFMAYAARARPTFTGEAIPHERKLVGYAMALIYPSSHYRDLVVCQMDAIYVTPVWRHCGAGLGLIRAVRAEARRCGAAQFRIAARPDSELSKILPKLGLDVQETVFLEVL